MSQKKNSFFTTRKIVIIGMMTAVASVVYYLDFPIPGIMPSFIKLDFSNVISLLAGFAMGPVEGDLFESMDEVEHISEIEKPYTLADKRFRNNNGYR